jgi:exosortase
MTPRNHVLAFVFLGAASILFWWHFLVITFGLALANDAYTHILLILPLSAALIYTDSKQAAPKHPHSKSVKSNARPINSQPSIRTNFRANFRIGAPLLAGALLIGCYARWGMAAASGDIRLSLGMFALVTWWIASVIFCFGVEALRAFLFPLCFLFLMVPIPECALSWIVEFLQQQSALAARIMFRVLRVPVTQDGIMLYIPNLDIEVARECSSIRSSLMLVVTTLVLAHLFLRSTWRQALLIAAAIPLAVAKNGLRIVTIAELGTRVDPGFLNGKFHHNGGIVFFGIAVVAVLALLWLLRRTEFQSPLKQPAPFLK